MSLYCRFELNILFLLQVISAKCDTERPTKQKYRKKENTKSHLQTPGEPHKCRSGCKCRKTQPKSEIPQLASNSINHQRGGWKRSKQCWSTHAALAGDVSNYRGAFLLFCLHNSDITAAVQCPVVFCVSSQHKSNKALGFIVLLCSLSLNTVHFVFVF